MEKTSNRLTTREGVKMTIYEMAQVLVSEGVCDSIEAAYQHMEDVGLQRAHDTLDGSRVAP